MRFGVRALLPWVPTVVGVAVLLGMVGVTAFRLAPPPSDDIVLRPGPTLPEPAPVRTVPPSDPSVVPSVVPPVVVPSVTSAPVARPSHSRSPSGKPSSKPSPTPSRPAERPPAVTGDYRVIDSYDREFIGEVLISNSAAEPADWVVRLRFGDQVGDLRTSWVESAPQATPSRSGDTFVWRSGVPVNGGSSVALRFQFERTGTGDRPVSCTVNGAPCG